VIVDLYEQFRALLTGDKLSPEEKNELSRRILEIVFSEEDE
jgi:hypothetical protein